jgi:Protein of unknown function (DUF4013)
VGLRETAQQGAPAANAMHMSSTHEEQHLGSRSDVSLARSAAAVLGSRRLWSLIAAGTVLLTIESAISTGPLQVLGILAESLVVGYQVCVSRAVVDGDDPLPSPRRLKVILRRGLSAIILLIVAFIPAFLFFAVALGLSLPLMTLPGLSIGWATLMLPFVRSYATWWLTVLLEVFGVALMTTVTARYVAFDRLGEGFRYGDAMRAVRAHTSAWLKTTCWTLAGSLTLVTLRFGVLAMLGLSAARARTAALDQLWQSGHGMGLVLLTVDFAFSALTAPWLLISAHLLGQYALAAFVSRQASDEV